MFSTPIASQPQSKSSHNPRPTQAWLQPLPDPQHELPSLRILQGSTRLASCKCFTSWQTLDARNVCGSAPCSGFGWHDLTTRQSARLRESQARLRDRHPRRTPPEQAGLDRQTDHDSIGSRKRLVKTAIQTLRPRLTRRLSNSYPALFRTTIWPTLVSSMIVVIIPPVAGFPGLRARCLRRRRGNVPS